MAIHRVMTLSTRQLHLLQDVAQGHGFDPNLEPELETLEAAGFLEIHFKHRDPDTGDFDNIVALLTRAGWDLVQEANAFENDDTSPNLRAS